MAETGYGRLSIEACNADDMISITSGEYTTAANPKTVAAVIPCPAGIGGAPQIPSTEAISCVERLRFQCIDERIALQRNSANAPTTCCPFDISR